MIKRGWEGHWEAEGGRDGRARMTCRNAAVCPAVRWIAHPKGGVYYKGKGKETGTLHPVSCCEPIFLFCMPGQRIVCSSRIASNQFRAVMRANKLPRPPAVWGNSRLSWRGIQKEESWSGDFSFSLCLFPPLALYTRGMSQRRDSNQMSSICLAR